MAASVRLAVSVLFRMLLTWLPTVFMLMKRSSPISRSDFPPQINCSTSTSRWVNPSGNAGIFSLGVMLYEMATGKRPFKGASAIELRSSVLKDTPPVVTEIRPELPHHLGRVIGRCLEKSPANRYQTARDVFNELKGLREETSSPRSAASAPEMRAADTIHRRPAWHRPSPKLLAALAVLLVAAIVATGWWWSQREAKPPAPSRVANRVIVTEFENRTEDPSLDHLGRTIAGRRCTGRAGGATGRGRWPCCRTWSRASSD